MKRKIMKQMVVAAAIGIPALAQAGTAQVISPQTNNWQDLAAKSKLIRLPDGKLVSTFAYGNDQDNETVYDPKAQAERAARDIWVTVSSDDGVSWSTPINISDTARFTSRTTSWQYDEVAGDLAPAAAFYGDSGKPNIFNRGAVIMITWVDKFCPADGLGGTSSASSAENPDQGAINYLDRDGRQVPYSCLYTAFTKSDPSLKTNWTVKQLTFGERDAAQDVSRGFTVKDPVTGATTSIPWAITWQEDPSGLQAGGADGPGDGVSGAKVTKGTDIWYTYVDDLRAGTAGDDLFGNIQRLTQNFQQFKRKEGGFDLVPLSGRPIESGIEGASRANTNFFQVPGQQTPKVIVAYEETKGAGSEIDFGKVIRYHQFDYDNPPSSTETKNFSGLSSENGFDSDDVDVPLVSDPERIACVISDPSKNGRRVRFFGNPTNGSVEASGAKITFLWKEGAFDQGGPSDIMSRVGYIQSGVSGSTGLRPEDLSPAVAGNCVYSLTDTDRANLDTLADIITGNEVGINLSHQAESATGSSYSVASLQIDTEDDTLEDARAHRGAIRGDTIFLGYTHTPDAALAKYTDLANYNFYIRRSFDGGRTWTSARNISNIDDTTVSVKEPRIVATPGDGPTCDRDAGDTWETNDDCQNPDAYVVAWGTEQNVYDQLGGSMDLDIFVTGTLNAGNTYLPLALLAGNPANLNNPEDDEEAESQLRPNPAATALYAVYNGNQVDPSNGSIIDTHAKFISGNALNLDEENRIDVPIYSYETLAELDSDKSGSLGVALLGMLGLLGLRRRR